MDKPSVGQLAEILELEPTNFRGRPLSAVQQVCVALNYYAGGHLTRIAGLCSGISQKTAWRAIHRVTDKLCLLKDEYIRFPTDAEKAETAQYILHRFGLPGFAYAVDGVIVKFEEAPRGIPPGNVKQDYWNRKFCHAINVQIIGNEKKLILDINANFQGSANDARVWKNSSAKEVVHRNHEYLLAGDSAYPITPVLITPYRSNEGLVDDRTKREFNTRHSGLRTVMSENIFGLWKRRFPVLKQLRCTYPRARKVVIATAILHNMALLWGDVFPDVETPPASPIAEPDNNDQIEVEYNPGPDAIRMAGQLRRDQLRLGMEPRRRR